MKQINVDSRSIAFYHSSTTAAFLCAKSFAGKKGFIATIPHIILSRLSSNSDAVAWREYFTSLTSEYLGYTRLGIAIIVVAHGIGPLSTLSGILNAYSIGQDAQKAKCGIGRITQKQFRALESGKYGEVEIIELKTFLDLCRYPFIEVLTEQQSNSNPLISARLGPNAEAYIRRHANLCRRWHQQKGHGDIDDPLVLSMRDGITINYCHHEPKSSTAIAHLLSIGGLTIYHEPGYRPSLVSHIVCHDWSDGVRFIGVKEC